MLSPIFEWYGLRCGSKNGYQKDTCLKRLTRYSKYVDHSRFNNQHDGGAHMTT